jgi:rhamnose transport system ATP-binding protein
MALVRLTGVTKTFGGVHALRSVSFELRAGEVHALVGENGAGKSTMVRILTGAHAPDSGAIEIDGRSVDAAQIDPVSMRARGIAPIYQQPALFPDLTVAENLAVGFEPPGAWRLVSWRTRRARARELLDRVGATIDVDAPARSLRMAEQQLVEIARALAADSRILLMDEPTASLTGREATRLFELIHELRSRSIGIVYVSHRLEEIAALADRVSVLRDGELVATREMAQTSPAELIRLMVGRDLQAISPKREVPIGGIVLETEKLGCRATAVGNVSLQVRAGEIVGLAGLVGSGRTELAQSLFGLKAADDGAIKLDGRPVTVQSPADARRLGLAYLPEDRRRHGVIPEMSVAANTTLASLGEISSAGFIDFRKERDVASEYSTRLAIKARSIDAPVATLSGGNQQKVALSRWLATRPRVLILDEPTQGVDVGAKAEIHRLIVDLAAAGMAILLISSELPEILGMSDRVVVMRGGTVAGMLERSKATPEAVMALAVGKGDSHLFTKSEKR